MLNHLVLIAVKQGTTDEQVAAALEGLAALPAAIPVIRSLTCGRDAGISATAVDLAFVATFADAEAYEAYRTHPAHGAVARDLLRPIAETVTISQFVSDG